MEFLFKGKSLNHNKEILESILSPGYDFATIVYDKLKQTNSSVKMVKMDGLDKSGKILKEFFVVVPIISQNTFYYINANGQKAFSQYGISLLKNKYNLSSLYVNEIENIYEYKNRSNPKARSYSQEILKDFYIIKKQELVKDKSNNEYKLIIVENADLSIGEHLYVDELMLFKGQRKIGYLKAKYAPGDKIESYSVENPKKDLFYNKATIDYSFLEDEFKNKGLGYVMYFHMAQHLTNKSIDFRQSTLCSESAQKLWLGIEKHWQFMIHKEQIGNPKTNVRFLKVGQDCVLEFMENKPVVKMKNKI